MSSPGRIGAVVVSHDSAGDLPACLEALVGAEGVARVVVVDNASSDGSRAVVAGIGDPRVTLLPFELNTGFAGGCNRGFRALAGEIEWIAVLNPDVVVSRDCLARATTALAAAPDAGAAAPRLMRPGGRIVDSVGQGLHRLTLEVRDRGYGDGLDESLLRARPVLAPCGALAVFRRAALDRVAEREGPWAEPYFCFWEDLELGWRLANLGWSTITVPDAVATHRRGAGARSGPGPLRWRRPEHLEACILTNRWMTLIRHLHPLDLSPRIPLLLAWDLTAVVLGVLRRPRLAGHLRRRWPLVAAEWRRRRTRPRRRLHELPWLSG